MRATQSKIQIYKKEPDSYYKEEVRYDMMLSLPKMKLSCLHPRLHLSSSRLLAETQALPNSSIRSRTSSLVRCGSARRRKPTAKSIKSLEKAHPLGLEKKQWRRYALVSGVSVGLMEEFWDNVRRYGLYALTVSPGALSAVFEPIFELLKNPISALLILIILGGSFYIVSQVVSSMVGVNEFVYDYGYRPTIATIVCSLFINTLLWWSSIYGFVIQSMNEVDTFYLTFKSTKRCTC
ncbi:hypothetical protein Bca52824_089947 [Brassica carinata]|uniref:Uncharacterized protein ycf33 n=1 Tax=Brassica carinata TaxID=52824 RepID=A0A8X7TEU9_BRACI|nr:hypothetical protein Bca52824_089947 [Brassica carinata]